MASDVEIVIGAKDAATKTLQKVAGGTRNMSRSVQTMATKTKRSTEKVSKAFTALKSTVLPLLAAFAAFKSATAVFRVVGSSAEAFDIQADAVRGLTMAIELSGDAVGPTIDQHKEWASALQNVVNVGDEVTLGLMKQASMLGVSNDQLQDVTKAAIGLAEATGMSLQSALTKTNEAINGNASGLQRYLPALRQATTEEEKLAIIMETSQKGLAQKADRAKTAQGAGERLANSWGDFLEVIGKAMAPMREFISRGLTVLVETIQTSVIPALNAIMPSAESIGVAMAKMRTTIISAVTIAEVVIGNLGNIWELLKTKVALVVTSIAEDVKHAFTVVIPSYGKWFADNFTNMMVDAFTGIVTALSNAATNIKDIIQVLWKNVKSGFSGGFGAAMSEIADIASRNLLEGFEAKTKALPKIMARSITDGEREMMAKIGGLAGNLADEYTSKMKARLSASADGKGLLGDLNLLGIGGATDADGSGGKLGSSSGGAVSSRLLTRGKTEDGPKVMIKVLEKMVEEQKKTNEMLGKEKGLDGDSLSIEVIG